MAGNRQYVKIFYKTLLHLVDNLLGKNLQPEKVNIPKGSIPTNMSFFILSSHILNLIVPYHSINRYRIGLFNRQNYQLLCLSFQRLAPLSLVADLNDVPCYPILVLHCKKKTQSF